MSTISDKTDYNYNFARTEQNVTFINSCINCRKTNSITLDDKDYEIWKSTQRHIQSIFHYLSIDERELLLTGTHPECWIAMFPEDEDEEGI